MTDMMRAYSHYPESLIRGSDATTNGHKTGHINRQFLQQMFKLCMRTGLLTFLLLVFVTAIAVAQTATGTLKGRITSAGEGSAYAKVLLLDLKGGFIMGTESDGTGRYILQNIPPGKYNLKVMDIEGSEQMIPNVVVSADLTTEKNVKMGIETAVVEIDGGEPIVKQDNVVRKSEYDLKSIRTVAGRGIGDIAATGAGVYQADAGGGISVRGGLGNQSQTFVDGARVIGSIGLPQMAISNLSIITGGTPPWYGDLTSGVIEITTADPPTQSFYSAEALTSQFLDPYSNNLLAVGLGGPLITKFDSVNKIKITKLGYFFSTEGSYNLDGSPAAGGVWRMKPNELSRLEANPLRPDESGQFFINNANFVRKDKLEKVKTKDNNWGWGVNLNGRLDYKLNQNTTLKFGTNVGYGMNRGWSLGNSLFAPQANGYGRSYNTRSFLRFTQVITPDSAHSSILKSMFYSLQAEYTRNGSWGENPEWKDDIFQYGYVGRFENRRAEAFSLVSPGQAGHNPAFSSNDYWQTGGFIDTAYVFNPSRSNYPVYANYNTFIQDYLRNNPRPFQNAFFAQSFGELRGSVYDWVDLNRMGGILNGGGASGIYSMYTAPGALPGGYSKSRFDMVRITGQATVTLGKKTSKDESESDLAKKGTHTLRFGFEFEQRYSRSYGIAAGGLWGLMRNLVNKHVQGVDTTMKFAYRDAEGNYYAEQGQDGSFRYRLRPGSLTPEAGTWNANGTYFNDTVRLVPSFDALQQANFDRNLRTKLGMATDSRDWINTDGLDPSVYSVDMFSADELFNVGKPLVDYFGYNYIGDFKNRTAPENFFTDKTNRPMNAFAPTYMAGYIQDKFELDKLFLTIGVRVDRLDMNQMVLKDKFVVTEAYNAGDVLNTRPELLDGGALPANVSKDWVPYATNIDINSPDNRVIGYRDSQNRWYDRNGNITDPQLLFQDGKVRPLVKYPNSPDTLTFGAFKDYEPQVNVMPRVSFSFPITAEANFFAHYDVLTQRPTGANFTNFTDYLFLLQNATSAINNPALKPQKTIDYEIGFQQLLDKKGNLALIISAFYREIRNEIQILRNNNAYPITYDSFENIDFGTVKGFTFEFKTRRIGLFKFNANYTLQYAEATGSGFGSSRNALNGVQGFSVLRNLLWRSFDQRHTFAGTIDFGFDQFVNTGPTILGYKPFKSFSAGLTYRLGSGTPYTQNAIPNQADVMGGVNPTIQTKGVPMGARLPWNYNIDLRLDKVFLVDLSKDKGEGEAESDAAPKLMTVNVYLVFLNLLNRRNVLSVYSYSGLVDNSGYLESSLGPLLVERQFDPAAFVDQWRIAEQNPGRWSLPRRIRLGCIISF